MLALPEKSRLEASHIMINVINRLYLLSSLTEVPLEWLNPNYLKFPRLGLHLRGELLSLVGSYKGR